MILFSRNIIRPALFSVIASFAFFMYSVSSAYAMNITVRISDRYTEVRSGDRLYFEIDIKYPENPSRKDLRMEYQIRRGDEVVARQNVLRAVETQVSFLDYIAIPSSEESGMYELNVTIRDYQKLHQETSATFRVRKGRDQVITYFFILLGVTIFVALLVTAHIILELRQRRATLFH